MPNRRISVLFNASDLTGGGAERFTSNVLQNLDQTRFEPHLCLWRDNITYPLPGDLPIYSIGKEKWWHLPKALLGTSKLIDDIKPDVVLSHTEHVALVTSESLRRITHHPFWIVRITNDPKRRFCRIHKLWLRRALPLAAKILCGSEGVRAAM